MTVAGKFPQRQRMPGVNRDAPGRQTLAGEEIHQQHKRDDLEADHRGLHCRRRLADPRDRQKNRLGQRWIDRHRGIGAIDVRKDVGIAQRCQLRICRCVAIGVDARGHDAAIPDIAIDIGRQSGRREHDRDAHQHRDCRNPQHDLARGAGSPYQPNCCQIHRSLQQDDGQKQTDIDVVGMLEREGEAGQREQRRPACREADPARPIHGPARPVGPSLSRGSPSSRKSCRIKAAVCAARYAAPGLCVSSVSRSSA